jgi:16S rRNA (adenine1518-N6/adenine1519-N6)-dimethyltransferase
VEIDPKACAVLKERFGDLENFHLVQRDILKLDLHALLKERQVQRLQIAANLPYYITTPVIAGLLEKEIPFERMVALTQLEVAQRLVAKPGGKAYAAISVLAQFWCRVTLLRKVPPGAFTPPPKVHSGLLLFERQASPSVKVGNRELFFKVARSSFGKRRKTLRNGLKMSGDLRLADRDLEAAFKKSGVDPQRRPETLSLGEFAALTDSIEELLCAE